MTTKKYWFAEYHQEHQGEYLCACHLCREETRRKFENMRAKEWFDSIEISDEMRKANEESTHKQWCLRHWAPGPILHFNGLGATIELMQEIVSHHMPPNMQSEAAMNRWIATHGPICCLVGEEKMYQIWDNWQPVEEHRDGS